MQVELGSEKCPRVTFGKAAANDLRARSSTLQPPDPDRMLQPFGVKYSEWLKREKAKYTGLRASSSTPASAAQTAQRQQAAARARAHSSEWSGDLDMSQIPFVHHASLVEPDVRGKLFSTHSRALPNFSTGYGGYVHESNGQRTMTVKMTGLRPPPSSYLKAQIFKPSMEEEVALRKLMAVAR